MLGTQRSILLYGHTGLKHTKNHIYGVHFGPTEAYARAGLSHVFADYFEFFFGSSTAPFGVSPGGGFDRLAPQSALSTGAHLRLQRQSPVFFLFSSVVLVSLAFSFDAVYASFSFFIS